MPTMKLPDTVAGVGARCQLVLMDRVVDCEITEAHVNAALKSVNGDMAFVDEALLVKFKIIAQTQDTKKVAAAQQAVAQASGFVAIDRGERQIDLG